MRRSLMVMIMITDQAPDRPTTRLVEDTLLIIYETVGVKKWKGPLYGWDNGTTYGTVRSLLSVRSS